MRMHLSLLKNHNLSKHLQPTQMAKVAPDRRAVAALKRNTVRKVSTFRGTQTSSVLRVATGVLLEEANTEVARVEGLNKIACNTAEVEKDACTASCLCIFQCRGREVFIQPLVSNNITHLVALVQ